MDSDTPKILIVDDNEAMASALGDFLGAAGFNCTHVSDSTEAMALLHTEKFGVAIFDMHMPGLNGMDLLRSARSLDEDMQVLIMTAHRQLDTAVSALKTGAFDYVSKGKPPAELLGLVRKAVCRREEAICKRTRLQALEQEIRLRTVELEHGNARLQELLLNVIRSMALALEARDPYTKGHSERVAVHSMAIAERLLLPQDQISRIQLAGLLHDIGKIGVREDVLMKVGRLTDDEYTDMKRHPEVGASILRPIAQFEDIIECVLYHHERVEGNGYPRGLNGPDIPLGAKILAVADAFDAMTSDRAYRARMTVEEAIDELIRCRGTQFEPIVADAFIKTIRTMDPGDAALPPLLPEPAGTA